MALRPLFLSGVVALALAACASPEPVVPLGPDGQPAQRVYRIAPGDAARIQYRALDALNTLRAQARLAPLALDARLNAAAATHSRDMSMQARAWLFASDGSPPIDRVARAGYPGAYRGGAVSETFESELETLNAWMADPEVRPILMDPEARDMGFAWHQDPNGKLWWTLFTGTPDAPPPGPLPAAGPTAPDVPGPFTPGVFMPMEPPRPLG